MARKPAVADKEVKVEVKEAKKYIALVDFYDRDRKVIRAGDEYASDDETWVKKLTGKNNSTGKPIIKEV